MQLHYTRCNMVHKFDPAHKKKLDSETRRSIMPPQETLIRLGLKAGDIIVDIGAGAGYFTFPAAALAGEKGRVIALDTSEEMLDEIRRQSETLHLSNIMTVLSAEYNFPLDAESTDFALICNVLHEVEDKQRFLREVHRVLKPEGILAIIEWTKTTVEFGPPPGERIDSESLQLLLREGLFDLKTDFELGDTFYAITAFASF